MNGKRPNRVLAALKRIEKQCEGVREFIKEAKEIATGILVQLILILIAMVSLVHSAHAVLEAIVRIAEHLS
jgi:hypothetical protein